jgi:hypothetical protein
MRMVMEVANIGMFCGRFASAEGDGSCAKATVIAPVHTSAAHSSVILIIVNTSTGPEFYRHNRIEQNGAASTS